MPRSEFANTEDCDYLMDPEARAALSGSRPAEEPAAAVEPVVTWHERIEELGGQLASRGNLGLIAIDLSALQHIEYEYGARAYDEVRERVLRILSEQAGRAYRWRDVLALDESEGLRFILFLKPKRKREQRLSPSDLMALGDRLQASLQKKMARAAFPYIAHPLRIELGYSLALHNPLLDPKRILKRAFDDALERAAHRRLTDRFQTQERLQEIIARGRITTSYQSILRFGDRKVLGFEALSRGADGTGLESPDELFAAAREHRLFVELDRLCRRRALERASRIPRQAKIFVNTLPSTIHDPDFRGKPLIAFLDRTRISPDRIVIEITEKLVIDNYSLFEDAMAYFTSLGIRFAVDDVGAGYSGLEAVARLKPAFLKVDMGLVRNVHMSRANQEMIKAIVSMGGGIEASTIAEGIQTEDEARTLQGIGVEYGQGYFLSRPLLGPDQE